MSTPDATPDRPDREPGHAEAGGAVMLPEPWERMTEGRDDDERLTIVVDGEPQPFFGRRELAGMFADPAHQERLARAREIADTHHWEESETIPGAQVLVPNE